MKYQVLISDPLSDEGVQELLDRGDIHVEKNTGLSEEELIEIIPEFDALIVRSQTQVTAKVLEHAKRLKVVGRAGVGVDNIDVNAATERGIIVLNAPDGNTISTAEHTMSMIMALARNIPQAYLKLKQNVWDRKSFVGVELNGKTLGIVGLGRIGSEVAKRAKAFQMHVIAYDPFLTEEKAEKMGISYGTLDDVVKQADFITVHTPLLKETKYMISHEQFERMKDGVFIVNCARGGIIEEDALYEAIVKGKVAGAALDVFEVEPAVNHKLLEFPQVIATPHLGASTVEAQENVAIDVCKEVSNVLHDLPFKNAVNIPSLPADVMQKIQPFFPLCEQLGLMLAQLSSGVFQEISITYAGDICDLDVGPLTRNITKGILAHYLGYQVNIINAPLLAKQKEIVIREQKTSQSKGFTNSITVELTTSKETRKATGTVLNGYGTRIVKLDGYTVDIIPEGHILYINHRDLPGVIGKMGMILGQFQINIATMQVGRKQLGGDAIMTLAIDKPLDQSLIEKLKQIDEVERVIPINL